VNGYVPRLFTHTQTVTHPSTNSTVHGRELNSQPVDPNLTPSDYTTESCKFVFLGALPIHLLRHFCCRIYSLATITASQTDRRTNRRQYHANAHHTISMMGIGSTIG